MKIVSKSLLAFATLFVGSVLAATSIEYDGYCKYVDSAKKTKYSGKCNINFGIAGVMGDSARYILTFPNKTEVEIYLFKNNLAAVNKTPAKTSINGRQMTVLTGEDETFVFSLPSKDSM